MMTLKKLTSEDIKPGNTEAVVFIQQLYEDTMKRYLKIHRDWYIYERFVRGDHWVIFNKTLNKVQIIPIQDGEIRRTINKIRSQIRGVKNFIKRNQPRWEVHPDGSSDQDLEEAQKKNKILQHKYVTLKFPELLTDVIVSGLKFSVGILEGGVIEEESKQVIRFWYHDPFDILFDPFASSVDTCRYIFKALKKPLTDIQDNPEYTIQGELKSDNQQSSSYKELLNREKYGSDLSGSGDLESCIVKELVVRYIEDGKSKFKRFTIAGGQLIKVKKSEYRRFNFFVYSPEKTPGAIYGDSWIKDLISINKSLDKSTSQIEAYIQRMLAGKYLIKQGVEVSSISDKGAEKIYYKGSTPPTQLNLQPLPAAPFNHLNNLERWIEELGGTREASLGRVPGGLQSGKAIEALQAADAATVSEPIENLQNFLSEISEFILELISDFTVASEEIVEDNEQIRFIGDVKGAPEGALKIKPGRVTTKIVPEIAYSEDMRFARLMQLAEGGLIDPQTVLEKLSVSNIGDIIERMEKQKNESFKQDMIKQRESHRTEGEGPTDSADLANQENLQMAAGVQVPMTPQALWVPEHTELHMAFIQQNMDAYEQNKELFDMHIQEEESY